MIGRTAPANVFLDKAVKAACLASSVSQISGAYSVNQTLLESSGYFTFPSGKKDLLYYTGLLARLVQQHAGISGQLFDRCFRGRQLKINAANNK